MPLLNHGAARQSLGLRRAQADGLRGAASTEVVVVLKQKKMGQVRGATTSPLRKKAGKRAAVGLWLLAPESCHEHDSCVQDCLHEAILEMVHLLGGQCVPSFTSETS